MKHPCIFCFTRAFEDKLKEMSIGEDLKNKLVAEFYSQVADHGLTKSAPGFIADIYGMIRKKTGIIDPYLKEKYFINQYLLRLYPDLKKQVLESEDPFNKALRLSIAGNIIDSIASPQYNIQNTIDHVLSSGFKIDHSQLLKEEIHKADLILYLGDNAGEIVMDKLFIETIGHPNVYYAVRGYPILNDVTITDAELVGMNATARVISNGSDAPSTILNRVSSEFLEVFNAADLIISKGQGNLEGLIREKRNNIFFLFMVKCETIGNIIKAGKGDFVVMNSMMIEQPVPAL